MAEASGLTAQALRDVIERRCPLGVNPLRWQMVLRMMTAAMRIPNRMGANDEVRSLNDGRLQIAVGGSSVAGFSSAQTAMEKKRFPYDEHDLEHQIRRSPVNAGCSDAELQVKVEDAKDVYRSLDVSRARPPRAPWFGIMSRLHVEGPADVDIQLHSDVIDERLLRRAARDPGIVERRDADRLRRWDPADVRDAFPVLAALEERIVQMGVPVELEYLGPGGGATIEARPDWWRLDDRIPARA